MSVRDLSLKSCFKGMMIAICVVTPGCNDRPKDVLSDKEMIDLMADMQLAEGYADVAGSGRNYSSERFRLTEGVLAAHGVSRAQLDSTMLWYGKNIDDYNALFAGVDKELDKRRRTLLKDGGFPEEEEGVGLWPYSAHIVLSPLGDTDHIRFSILPGEDTAKGDLITWKLRFNAMSEASGLLGVDYTDGASSLISRNLNGNQKVELKLQTDSSKSVSRIFGVMRVRNANSLPLFVDSISLTRSPLDSSRYYTFHSQILLRPQVKSVKKDSVAVSSRDSISKETSKK